MVSIENPLIQFEAKGSVSSDPLNALCIGK